MGMCYSVNLKLVYRADCEQAMKQLMFGSLPDCRHPLVVTEDTSIVDVLRFMFPNITGKRRDESGIVILEGHADFDASYGWDSAMTEWFEDISALLLDNSELEDYPDNGYEKLFVKDGKLYQVYMEYADWHRIFFTYNGTMFSLDVGDGTLDDPEEFPKHYDKQLEIIQESYKASWHMIGKVMNKQTDIQLISCIPILANSAYEYQPKEVNRLEAVV